MPGRSRAERAHRALAVVDLSATVAVALALSGAGCANPVAQYHRQLEYLLKTSAEAQEERRFEDALESLLDAVDVLPFAEASDLERIETRTRLIAAHRELGQLDEGLAHAKAASKILARYRLEQGGASSGVYEVGALYLLERSRLEIVRRDLSAAEQALADFVAVRGTRGGDARESAQAQLLLGELRLARGADEEALESFRSALDRARDLDGDDAGLRGFVLLRVADAELTAERRERARALLDEARPEEVTSRPLVPGVLLTRARMDLFEGNRERAVERLDRAIAMLASDDPDWIRDWAAPARAVALAAALFASGSESSASETVSRIEPLLAVADDGSPLRALQVGRQAFQLGRSLVDAGAAAQGLQLMAAGREVMATAVAGHPHDALVEASFELAMALESTGRLALAAPHCEWLVEVSGSLTPRAVEAHPQRLELCGRLAVRAGDAGSARGAYGRALMIAEAEEAPPRVRLSLLLRLAALAHAEQRSAEEEKLFDRVLPFVLPGRYAELEELIVEAYGAHGRFQPSSAAARLGHAAARSRSSAVEAPRLQEMAEQLGGEALPASAAP